MAQCTNLLPALLGLLVSLPGPADAASGPDDQPQTVLSQADRRHLAAQLGNRRFTIREQASRRLARSGAAVYPLLRQLVATHPDAEVRRRAASILDIPAQQRASADYLTGRLLPLMDLFCEDDVYEIKPGPLIAHSIRRLYERLHVPVPPALAGRLRQVRGLKPDACERLLSDACLILIQRGHRDMEVLFQQFIQASWVDLDPYSSVYPDTGFLCRLPSASVGVGLELASDPTTGTIRVVTPLAGSPACQAGIRAGDHITHVGLWQDENGTPLIRPRLVSTFGRTVKDVQHLLFGVSDTRVTLGIEEAGTGRGRFVDVVRQTTHEETVFGCQRQKDGSWRYWIDPSQRIGYLRLTRFSMPTLEDLTRVLQQLKKGGVRGLVIDLRFCPGGLLSTAVIGANRFLPAGRIVTIPPRLGKPVTYLAEAAEYRLTVPMVCLVNRETASSAELLAACLQDHGLAAIMGERTRGRASIQNIQRIPDGYEAKLSTALLLRPSGKKLDRMRLPGHDPDEWGVRPDHGFAFPLDETEYHRLRQHLEQQRLIVRYASLDHHGSRAQEDRVLTAAVRVLRDLLEPTTRWLAFGHQSEGRKKPGA